MTVLVGERSGGDDREAIGEEVGVAMYRVKKASTSDNAWQFLMVRADDESLFCRLLDAAAQRSPVIEAAVTEYWQGR